MVRAFIRHYFANDVKTSKSALAAIMVISWQCSNALKYISVNSRQLHGNIGLSGTYHRGPSISYVCTSRGGGGFKSPRNAPRYKTYSV